MEALRTAIPRAKKRIVIHAMGISWGPVTEQLAPLLIDAAGRGVDVRLIGDIYTKFYANMPHPSRNKPPSWKHVESINTTLVAAGIHVTYIGRLWLNPYKRRCHSKITIIDDIAYTFGGINFSSDSFKNHDYMLKANDSELADTLCKLVRELEDDPKQPLQDRHIQINGTDTLLFDGGTAGKSIIYETSCDVVAQAKKVYYVSQMCPSGKLAELITAADNECYFIRLAQADPPSHIDLAWDAFRYGIKNRYTGSTYIHAKFILTEGHDGSKHLISGSNNFSWRGVKYGTKEIAVHSTDPLLWDAFHNFLRQRISA